LSSQQKVGLTSGKPMPEEQKTSIRNKLKKNNQLSIEINKMYDILSNNAKREKYDELLEKHNKLLLIKIPFFGYDFDEKYTTYEKKKYLIDNNIYLISEKNIVNGRVDKKYYIEIEGKTKLLSEEIINKLKNEYYKKQENSELLKDSTPNKVLPK
jgi:curved DNA-binding protein CbpA